MTGHRTTHRYRIHLQYTSCNRIPNISCKSLPMCTASTRWSKLFGGIDVTRFVRTHGRKIYSSPSTRSRMLARILGHDQAKIFWQQYSSRSHCLQDPAYRAQYAESDGESKGFRNGFIRQWTAHGSFWKQFSFD
jgi:hypothetical protein